MKKGGSYTTLGKLWIVTFEGLVWITPNLFPTNQLLRCFNGTSVPTLDPSSICSYSSRSVPYNFVIVVQPEGNNICKYYSFFVSPYYTVYDGINQVNNYGRNQPKTRVKQKNILLLHKYNSYYITKFSTSFHLGGLSSHIRARGSQL